MNLHLIDNRTNVCYYIYIATLVRALTGDEHMDYKKLIIELLNKTENIELLELIYRFCKKIIG